MKDAKKQNADGKIIFSDDCTSSEEDVPKRPRAKRGPYKTSLGGQQKLTPEQKRENRKKAQKKYQK